MTSFAQKKEHGDGHALHAAAEAIGLVHGAAEVGGLAFHHGGLANRILHKTSKALGPLAALGGINKMVHGENVGEKLIGGLETGSGVASMVAPGLATVLGPLALFAGLGQLAMSDATDAYAQHTDNRHQRQLGTRFYDDPSMRGAENIHKHGFNMDEYVHNYIYRSKRDAQALNQAQARVNDHYAE